MKKFYKLSVCSVFMALAMTTASSAQTVLKYAQGLSMTNNHQAAGVQAFQESLRRLTNGRYDIQIFPNSSLGGERAMVEGLQVGTIDLVQTTIGPLGNWVPEIDVLALPFLFRDLPHARKVLVGEVGEDLLKKFGSDSFIGLAWTEDGGMRHVFNNKRAVKTPADLKGLKIRVQENKVHTLAFSTMGALPTPMAFPNMFSAMQQGVIDGGELSLTTTRSNNFAQVSKSLTLTGHFYSAAVFLMSPASWNKLTDEDKKNFREAARIGAQASYKYIDDTYQQNIDEFRKGGLEVIEKIDLEQFREAVRPAYESDYNARFGKELIAKIAQTN